MLPISTIDRPSDGAFKSVCRQILPKQISNHKENCKRSLRSFMETQDFVCTTVDIWSKNNKSIFGATAHIIDTESLKRKSFVLA